MEGYDFDIAIIGGGIVGCAVLFELTRHGFRCLLLEKNEALLSGASCGNSGVLHTGFDAPDNSLELGCIRACQENIFPILTKFNVPFKRCGGCLVAWTQDETSHFSHLQRKCKSTGIFDSQILSPSELFQREPYLRSTAQGALLVPGEGVVDSNLLGLSYAHHARKHGAQIKTSCEVKGFEDGHTIVTNKGNFSCGAIINCAGLFGDVVDNFAGINTFSILPRKGQYAIFSKKAQSILGSMLFPIPSEKTKGVGLFKTVYDSVVVGPTAEDVKERVPSPLCADTHDWLLKTAAHLMPALGNYECVGQYMGVRPATQFKDFQITSYPSRHWITVGGIRSTGVSASLGIAQLVADKLYSDMKAEPSRGALWHVEPQHWVFKENGAKVSIDDYTYTTTHPICHFGHQNSQSKL